MLRSIAILVCAVLTLGTLSLYVLSAQAMPHQAAQASPVTLKVFFPKASDPDPTHVYSVSRFATPPATATYAMQLVIGGPTLAEQNAYGVYSEVNELLVGVSNCMHRDFRISLDHKGGTPTPGTATLQFCRDTQSPGELTDARVLTQINATLKQFPAIKIVVVLTKAGHCFGDLSGIDHCLQ